MSWVYLEHEIQRFKNILVENIFNQRNNTDFSQRSQNERILQIINMAFQKKKCHRFYCFEFRILDLQIQIFFMSYYGFRKKNFLFMYIVRFKKK